MKRWDENCPGDRVAISIGEFVTGIENESGERIAPRDINAGYCFDVADHVAYTLKGVKSIRLVDELFPAMPEDEKMRLEDDHESIIHQIVKYRGKYYDAEIPCGVMSVDEIPTVKRFRKSTSEKK